MNKLRLSLVIPAYNEARHLRQCLEAVAAQTVAPYEVIVVDNNSSDATVAITQEFPFVTLMSESCQGVVFARDAGFYRASGDIIGRIDADTLILPNWTETVLQAFQNDPALDGLSGQARYYDIALAAVANRLDLFWRRRFGRLFSKTNTVFMQGANMAVRRSAWQHVHSILCRHGSIHEDVDLSIHLQEYGHKVRFYEQAIASLSSRRIDVGFTKFLRYVYMSPHTYAVHNAVGISHMYPAAALAILCYLPGRLLHRGYDAQKGGFSFTRLWLSSSSARIDPTLLP